MENLQARIPLFPPVLGEDCEDLLMHYDKIQAKLDTEMIKKLKDDLDGLLVFAGLLAGVNTAFIALALINMAPDPDDDITALLSQLVQGLRDPTSLPSTSFTPSSRALAINTLFTLSLASTLIASVFAILGKQCIIIYRKESEGGLDEQRWEQLSRSLGVERWRLVPLLEMLPLIIQGALIFFSIGVVLFLGTISQSLARAMLFPLCAATLAYIVAVGMSLWDYFCPFRSPLVQIAPRILSAIGRNIRPAKTRILETIRKGSKRLQAWMKNPLASGNEGDKGGEKGEVLASGGYSRFDEEKGNAAISQDAGQPRSVKERWRSLINAVMRKRPQPLMRQRLVPWGWLTRLQDFLPVGRKIEGGGVLRAEAMIRVIRFSKVPESQYLAALHLRSITDSDLLEVVRRSKRGTDGLRRAFLKVIEEGNQSSSRAFLKVSEESNQSSSSTKDTTSHLRRALGFGTAFFHFALSASSFDEFIEILGVKHRLPPPGTLNISPKAAQDAGDACRDAATHLLVFMNLQLSRLGAQPEELTATTLAASAFWYAINGIPHSQDVVYGDRFREALIDSEVSWAGLGLLASVSNLTCQFHDVRKEKPYGTQELDWCRSAFLCVRKAYLLSQPTKELADAIHASLSSGRNLESNAILFKFAWTLFAERDGEHSTVIQLAERALSAGPHLICFIEKSIRSSKGGKKYLGAREICFKAMIGSVGQRGGTLKGVAWRQRLMIMTATAYMKYIMDLEGRVDVEENTYAKGVMQQIRAQSQTLPLPTLVAMGKDLEYVEAKRAFEGAFSKFGLHIPDDIDRASTVAADELPNDLSS